MSLPARGSLLPDRLDSATMRSSAGPRRALSRSAVVAFSFYAATGQVRYRRIGLLTLKWTLIAAFGFFAVLVLERIA